MKAQAFILSAILGLSIPAVSLSFAPAATAQAPTKLQNIFKLQGMFLDSDWAIYLTLDNKGVHKYRGLNLKTNQSIELKQSKVSSNDLGQVYTWQNGSSKYQIIWQAQNPDFIRLQVFQNGKMTLDRMLTSFLIADDAKQVPTNQIALRIK
jgi:hypothetical protein